jgi:3'(2'), 5'-bisphosphate nucleotidase
LGCPNITTGLKEEIGGEGSLLIGKRGNGSWIGTLKGYPSPDHFHSLKVSDRATPTEARLLRSYESSHTNTSQIDAFKVAIGSKADPVRMDSQVKYAFLAAGKGEIYLRLLASDKMDYREKIWDQAAGSIIVEEAGGIVTDLDGRVLDFAQGRTLKRNRGICASNGKFHDQVLSALHKVNA